MLYLSELLGKTVVNKQNETIGKLSDLVFVTSEVPLITKIQVRHDGKTSLYPTSSLKKINGSITIDSEEEAKLAENEVFMALNLLDQQIIDIKGRNIVRVNDVVIQDKPTLTVSGMDIGLTGILRWFYLEDPIQRLLRRVHQQLPNDNLPWAEIQPLELVRGKVVFNKEENKLTKIAPEDLADYLEQTTIQNALKILALMNDETASEVIQNLNIYFQTQLFNKMPPEAAAKIVAFADPDEACDLLFDVTPMKRQHILSFVSAEKRKELEYLLRHTDTDLGELMTTEFLVFSPEDTVRMTIDKIRKSSGNFADLPYGYVINKNEELIGVFSLHELLLQNDATLLMKFMVQRVIVAHLTTPRETAAKRMIKFHLRSIPVIDAQKKIMGVVTFDDLVTPLVENKI